jgi:two-component system, cell cycle sensor histidine kinase and response regulator CckA
MSTHSSPEQPHRIGVPPVSSEEFDKLVQLIARSQQGYRTLIDSLDQALFALSPKGEVLVANLRLAEILGVSFPDLIGHSLGEFVESPPSDKISAALPSVLAKGSWSGTLAVRLKCDQEVRHFSCWFQAVSEKGQVASITGWARDVTREREAEVRFSELFESMGEGILFSTPEGKLLDANPALVHLLGYASKEELTSQNVDELYADSLDRASLIRELEQKGSVHDREIKLRRKDGKILRCLTSGFAIRDASGCPVRLQGTIVDITERAEMERRLHEEQELRRRLIANFPDLIMVLDRNREFTFISDQVKQILGWTPEEYIGAQIGARANPEDRAKLQGMVQSILNGETSRAQLEFNAPRKDGSWRTLIATASPLFDEKGQITGVITSARDITESRRIEKQLHKEQEFARRLIECFPHMIVVLDREGRFTFVSERVKEILGLSPEEYIGKEVGHGSDEESRQKIVGMFQNIISGRKHHEQSEIRARHADGTWRSLQVNASPLYDEYGKIIGMVSSGQDITESRRIEQQLLQKEKFAAMGQMMVGAAHELNNPLTAILGVADLLRGRASDEATCRQVDLVLKQARRAATIVQNLLAFSRPVTLGRAKLNLGEVVREVLQHEQPSLDQRKIRVTLESADNLPPVEGDRKLLKEVFVNIITNAEHAISAARDRGMLGVKLSVVGGYVRVSFADDGVGIAPESLGKIFDPFFTTKRTGGSSGLGLTICLAVIKEHGGRIQTESELGSGATFHILLPVSSEGVAATIPSDAPRVSKQSPEGAETLRGHTAIIVDDEESIREIVQEGLLARGMNVEAFGTSEAALAYLATKQCDVIVCDFNLPGMNGEQLFERVRSQQLDKMPRFVFMTGELFDAAAADRYRQAGAAILQKPFNIAALADLLVGILKHQSARVG